MKSVAERIYESGIVPVIKLDCAQDAVPLANALLEGGIGVAEVTFRTDAAEEAIRAIRGGQPQMLVGAGTVLTNQQADRAVQAGAQFIVTPGLNQEVVKHCLELGVPIFPGCNTPGTIEAAMALGLKDLKFFPAEQSGGLAMIKALGGPYSSVRFMPTGGINQGNLAEYLACDKVLACGGTWMVKDSLIREGRFDEITRLTREAVLTMLGFTLRHIGVNCQNSEEAMRQAQRISALLGWPVKEGNSSVFTGTGFEWMKEPYLGANGHIAIGVNSVVRAQAYLEAKGWAFRQDSAKRDGKGRLAAIYLQEEFGGFALHLVQQ